MSVDHQGRAAMDWQGPVTYMGRINDVKQEEGRGERRRREGGGIGCEGYDDDLR